MERRKHHKLAEFPPELVSAVNTQLQRGATYAEVTAWLNEKGAAIGKSSVARYARNFQATLDAMRVTADHMKVIVQEVGLDATAMQDAANQIALHQIVNFLMKLQDLEGADPVKVFRALAHLQSSSVQVTKLRVELSRQRQEAAADVADMVKKGGLSEEVIRQIEERVLGIAA